MYGVLKNLQIINKSTICLIMSMLAIIEAEAASRWKLCLVLLCYMYVYVTECMIQGHLHMI